MFISESWSSLKSSVFVSNDHILSGCDDLYLKDLPDCVAILDPSFSYSKLSSPCGVLEGASGSEPL